MTGYTKLFGSILESTVWLETPPIKVVWITMLAMADRDGVVEASVPGLAKRAGVERGHCEQALAIFLAPDPDSRTPDFEGRRIEAVAGGWRLLNYEVYRHRASADDVRAKAAARQRKHRSRLLNGLTCIYCGQASSGFDHVIPTCRGGKNEKENIVPSCLRCNRHKASRDLIDFLNDVTLPFDIDRAGVCQHPILGRLVMLLGDRFIANVTGVTSVTSVTNNASNDIAPAPAKEEEPAERTRTKSARDAEKPNKTNPGSQGPPLDVWLREFTELYPAQGRCSSHLTETAFFSVVGKIPRLDGSLGGSQEAYEALCARLEGHKRSDQWRRGKIPRLDRYLREGLHLQELPERQPDAKPASRHEPVPVSRFDESQISPWVIECRTLQHEPRCPSSATHALRLVVAETCQHWGVCESLAECKSKGS